MIVLFKLLGGYVGVRCAAFVGASPAMGLAVGVVFGHILDLSLQQKVQTAKAKKYWQARYRAEYNDRFVKSLFLMFGKLCVADGPLAHEETECITKVINDMLKLPRRSKKAALEIFRNAHLSPSSFQYDAAQFYELHQSDEKALQGMIDLLASIAACDGKVNAAEERLIRTAAQIFNMPDELYSAIVSRYGIVYRATGNGQAQYQRQEREAAPPPPRKDIDYFYSVLGCSRTDTVPVIKQNYRKLVSDYHPDKIVSKNLPEDFTKFANEKFKSIQEAYEAVKAEKGF